MATATPDLLGRPRLGDGANNIECPETANPTDVADATVDAQTLSG